MPRICPDCNVDLVPKDFKDVHLDVCPKCAGMFFDDEEIERLKALGGSSYDELEGNFTPITAGQAADAKRLCPGCGHAMHPFKYLYSTPVILDSCPACNGLWILHGELAQMHHYLDQAKIPDDAREAKARAAIAVAEMEGEEGSRVARAGAIEQFLRFLAHPMPPYFGFSDGDFKHVEGD